jgi:outer membrane protein assembly factor BamB
LRLSVFCAWGILTLFCLPGCRPALKTTEQAKPATRLERDPMEDGADSAGWPQWRGRNGSGVASAGNPAVQFSNTGGYRWKSNVPGEGNSSPVVWDRKILLTTEQPAGDSSTLALLCFDQNDGRLLWQSEAVSGSGRTHTKNGRASASVATDGERIFVFYGGAGLFCYDFSGKQIWHVDLGPIDHLWGLASSPVLFGSTVIQLCDHEGKSFIAAFEKATGHEVWRTPRTSKGSWSTPIFLEAKADADGRSRVEMIVNGGSGGDSRKVIAYDPNNGQELWRVGETTELVTPTPLYCNGLVYSISGRNGPILAIRPGGKGDVTATHLVWNASSGGPYIPSGVCYRNRLYVLFDNGTLTCYDPGDGRTIWQTRLPGPFTASLIAADGRLYAVNEHGRMSVVSVGDSFSVLSTNDLHSPCLATPAVADGELLVRTKSELFCFPPQKGEAKTQKDEAKTPKSETQKTVAASKSEPNSEAGENTNGAKNEGKVDGKGESPAIAPPTSASTLPISNVKSHAEGADWPLYRGDALASGVAHCGLPDSPELLWTFTEEKGGFESTAVIADGVVYVGSISGKFFAIDLADGKKRWEFVTKSTFTAPAAVRDGLVYVGDIDGRMHCLDAASGEEKWFFDADAEIDSGPNFYGDRLLFGSQDAFLYCLDAHSGDLAWKYESPNQIRCFSTVLGDLGFVAGCDGHLHCVDLVQGKELNQVDIQSPTGSSPAVLNDVIYVGTEGGQFFAIEPREPKILWRFENPNHGAAFRSSAAVTSQAVVVGSRDKHVYAFHPKSGDVLWSFPTKGRVDSSPVVVGQRVFVGSADGRLYAIDLKSGQSVWQFEAGGAILASPAVAQERLVIGNDSGSLYGFGVKSKP